MARLDALEHLSTYMPMSKGFVGLRPFLCLPVNMFCCCVHLRTGNIVSRQLHA